LTYVPLLIPIPSKILFPNALLSAAIPSLYSCFKKSISSHYVVIIISRISHKVNCIGIYLCRFLYNPSFFTFFISSHLTILSWRALSSSSPFRLPGPPEHSGSASSLPSCFEPYHRCSYCIALTPLLPSEARRSPSDLLVLCLKSTRSPPAPIYPSRSTG